MYSGQTYERCQAKRSHQRDGAIWNAPEQRISRAEMTDKKAGEQRAHARAQRYFNAANREGQEHTDKAAQEDRETEHDEINRRARGDNDAYVRGRLLHHGFRSDDPKKVSALQHDSGATGTSCPPRLRERT
jgi:hypothetical protein